MTSTGADFETESYLQHPDSSSEEHTSSDFVEKHESESSERECSESETEDDAELLQSTCVPFVNFSFFPMLNSRNVCEFTMLR